MPAEAQPLRRQNFRLIGIQEALHVRLHGQGTLATQHLAQGGAVIRGGSQPVLQAAGKLHLRRAAAHPALAQADKGGLRHALHAQVGQHAGNVGQKQRVGGKNHHLFGAEGIAEGIEQVGDAVQGDGGFAAARHALHNEVSLQGMADHAVLLGLDGGDDFLQPGGGHRAQHLLQVNVLADHAAVEQRNEALVLHGEHALEGQFALDAAVGGLVVHGAHLAGVVQICHRRAPVGHGDIKLWGFHHAPAAQVVGFHASALGNEVQAREIRLVAGALQVVQGVDFHAQDVQHHLLVHGGVVGHHHGALLPGADAGFLLQLVDFLPDDGAGCFKMGRLCGAVGMVGQNVGFHRPPFLQRHTKSPCFLMWIRRGLHQAASVCGLYYRHPRRLCQAFPLANAWVKP